MRPHLGWFRHGSQGQYHHVEYLGVHATRLSRSLEGNQAGRVEREKGRWRQRRRRRRWRGANVLLGEERRGWRSKEVSINNARPRLETWKTARLITLLLSLSCLRLYPYARQSGGAPLLLRSSSLCAPLQTNIVATHETYRALCYFFLFLSLSFYLSLPVPTSLSLPLLTRNVRAFSRSIRRSAFLFECVMASG